jgi:DNA-binding transcriptional LysR family regulator
MEMAQLEYFSKVVEEKSFSKAADPKNAGAD